MRHLFLSWFFLFGLTQSFAQGFKYAYKIDTVVKTDWYKLNLNEHLRARSKIDLADLRLVSDKDTIPYYIKEIASSAQVQEIKWLPSIYESSHSFLVQTQSTTLSHLQLKVLNHKQARRFSIVGSNNKKDWYPVSDLEYLQGNAHPQELFYWQDISLPLVNYAYLKFKFLDTAFEVPKIINVIAPQSKEVSNGYQPITQLSYAIQTLPEQQITRIKLFSNHSQWMHQISVKVNHPTFFYRRVLAYKLIHTRGKRGSVNTRRESLGEFILKSDQPNDIKFEHYLTDTLFLDIINEDNPPLEIASLLCFQRAINLFAYLNKGRAYHIVCGNSNALAPNYDISIFESKVNDQKVTLLNYRLDSTYLKHTSNSTSLSFYERKEFLWATLVIAVMVLLFFTSKLLKEKD